MKKIIFTLFLFLPLSKLYSLEVACNFEEVYLNGETQQGFFLLDDNNLRYQYYDERLFTIISTKNNYFLINNFDKNVQKINENTEFFDNLMVIANNYPDIQDNYFLDDSNIMIEKSHSNFIKRISIKSSNLNVSIHFFNCRFKAYHKKYFKHFDFEEFFLID